MNSVVRGIVQRVGLGPSIRKAAMRGGISSRTRDARKNGQDGQVGGDADVVESSVRAVRRATPRPANTPTILRDTARDLRAEDFRIVGKLATRAALPFIPPDRAMCTACRAEVMDPAARRHGYPFTTCAHCGPRYSILHALPYGRRDTSMADFVTCFECRRELEDPRNRRYRAQTIACARCGPNLSWTNMGSRAERDAALHAACDLLRRGGIVATAGLGGFQLLADATNARTVLELRLRERKPHEPFPVMFRDADQLRQSASFSEDDRRALLAPEAPVVLVQRREDAPIAREICPDTPWLGAMLPYTPLHALLLETAGGPLICTNGNTGQPLCITLGEAEERLGTIADGFLSHDLPIIRPVDDSVVRTWAGNTQVLRRSRGYAPLPVASIDEVASVLALGAHSHNTVTLAHEGSLIASQHLGDLGGAASLRLLERTVEELCRFLDARPQRIACDLNPEYASTRLAEELSERWSVPLVRVQHHHAHVAACVAEHRLKGEVLGLAWDGSGFGMDGTLWGSEALICRDAGFHRFAHLRPFPLPGGERAASAPRRAALGALVEFLPDEVERIAGPWFASCLPTLVEAAERRSNAPLCTSTGRLFDAIAALIGMADQTTYREQAGVLLESAARRAGPEHAYPIPLEESGGTIAGDIEPLVCALMADRKKGIGVEVIARRFHEALAEFGVAVAQAAGVGQVVLTGGCFENVLLSELLRDRLTKRGFTVILPLALPPNDGGISVGQAWIAAHQVAGE